MQALIWIHILGLFGAAVWMLIVFAKESKESMKG